MKKLHYQHEDHVFGKIDTKNDPYIKLWVAVLCNGINESIKDIIAGYSISNALIWLNAEDELNIGGFAWCCGLIGVSGEKMRKAVYTAAAKKTRMS